MADLPNFKFELEKASGWSGAAGSARQHTVNEFPVSTSFRGGFDATGTRRAARAALARDRSGVGLRRRADAAA